MAHLKKKLEHIPKAPGVYLFRNNKNKIIYIGKAANLKKRITSYFSRDNQRKIRLLSNTTNIDSIITNSDVEALTLEESLIKLHKPRYNVRLKDDKKFPYLKITIQEIFPRIIFTRDLKPDGSLIFGPYTSAKALRQTRDALCRVFKLVSCTKDLRKKHTRPCLEYNLSRCSAPCTRTINKKNYAGLVARAIEFLKGNSDELQKIIEKQMWGYVKAEKFEAASVLRDQLLAVRKISQRQQIVTADDISRDIIGIAHSKFKCIACLFKIRENRLISKEIYQLRINPHTSDEEISSAFIRLIYTHLSFFPKEIVIATKPSDWYIQSKWFKQKGVSIKISTGARNKLKRLLAWTKKNAENELIKKDLKRKIPNTLLELQKSLHLDIPPRWIEAFDVSNLKEKFAVGSSVAFHDGKPYKQRYRKYKIKRCQGQNDFAMIKEIVSRRIHDLCREKKLPDLLLVDGGKSQLSAALHALNEIKVKISVFAIAKKSDRLYAVDGSIISISPVSRSLVLLKKLRDEAHRFAVGYHRTVRGKKITESQLDVIVGIGKTRKLALLKYFGSLDEIKKASEEEIVKVPGIGRNIAKVIYESLHT